MKTTSASRRMLHLFVRAALALALLAGQAFGYLVGPAVPLEELAKQADLVFKAEVVASGAMPDAALPVLSGFASRETEFKIISVIKGEAPGPTLKFRHYDKDPGPGLAFMFMPQYYHFEREHVYLVFAKKTNVPGQYLQIWNSHTEKADQGVMRCADAKPVTAAHAKEAVWAELQAHLRSAEAFDVIYGLEQLDALSIDVGSSVIKDFPRRDALKEVAPLLHHADDYVVAAAVTFMGSRNPYMSEERAPFWLGTVGGRVNPGLGQMDPKMKNLGGELAAKELAGIVDGKAPSATRALAVRALGLVRDKALREPLHRWATDPEPEVRAAAALLLADFPDAQGAKLLRTLAGDADADVRMNAVYAIGFLQQPKLGSVLSEHLKDSDQKVRRAASESLLSFSPKIPEIAAWYRQNIDNEEFSPLFLNVLAAEKPGDYLEQLAEIVEKDKTPKNWSGGEIQSFTAWKTLFGYLRSQPVADVKAGKFDRQLAALESYFQVSSSLPRDLYAFYVQRGLAERAKRYREAAIKAVTYDLDYYFKQVDEAPARFLD